jgi:hypothetical protein
VVEAAFDGGDIVSDGGVLLLRRVDERLGLTRAAALALGDERRAASVQHDLRSLLAQRIYGLCLGWTDVCDHNALRNDLVMQTAVGRAEPLGSAPTLSRLETAAKPAHAAALQEVLMQQFIASHDKAPKELVLDVDATHVPLRRAWPKTKIIVRADSGFCRPRVLQRLERWRVNCIIGLQKNSRLNEQVALAELALAAQYAAKPSSACSASSSTPPAPGTRPVASSRGWSTVSKVPTRASSSPICRVRPRPCTSAGTVRAAKPRTGSRKRNSTCSAGVRVATASSPTSFGCCWRRWPTP